VQPEDPEKRIQSSSMTHNFLNALTHQDIIIQFCYHKYMVKTAEAFALISLSFPANHYIQYPVNGNLIPCNSPRSGTGRLSSGSLPA
jgi:hypothetical protein